MASSGTASSRTRELSHHLLVTAVSPDVSRLEPLHLYCCNEALPESSATSGTHRTPEVLPVGRRWLCELQA